MNIILTGVNNRNLNQQLKTYLTHLGSTTIQEAKDPDNLLRMARKNSPQLIIFDPGSFGPQGLQVGKIITREKISPIIFIVSQGIYRQTIEEIINKEAYASTYLVPPFSQEQLRIAITTTLAAFKKINELENKIIKLNESLAERKKINQAKELLIKQKGWTEPQAHRYLQRQSMSTGKPLKVIAQEILNQY